MNLKIVKIEEMEVLDKTNMYLFLYLILVWFGWTGCLCKYNIVHGQHGLFGDQQWKSFKKIKYMSIKLKYVGVKRQAGNWI